MYAIGSISKPSAPNSWAAVAALLVSAGMFSDVRPATAQHGGGGGHGGHGGFGGHGGHLGNGGFGFGLYGLGYGGYGYPYYGGYGYPYYGGYASYGGSDCYLARRRVVGPHGRVYFRRVAVCR